MQFSSTSWQKPDMCRLGAIQIMFRLHMSRLAGLIKWMAIAWAFGFISTINEFFCLASLLREVNFFHQVATSCVIHCKQNGTGTCFSSHTLVSPIIGILAMPSSHISFFSNIKSELTALLNARPFHFLVCLPPCIDCHR